MKTKVFVQKRRNVNLKKTDSIPSFLGQTASRSLNQCKRPSSEFKMAAIGLRRSRSQWVAAKAGTSTLLKPGIRTVIVIREAPWTTTGLTRSRGTRIGSSSASSRSRLSLTTRHSSTTRRSCSRSRSGRDSRPPRRRSHSSTKVIHSVTTSAPPATQARLQSSVKKELSRARHFARQPFCRGLYFCPHYRFVLII